MASERASDYEYVKPTMESIAERERYSRMTTSLPETFRLMDERHFLYQRVLELEALVVAEPTEEAETDGE